MDAAEEHEDTNSSIITRVAGCPAFSASFSCRSHSASLTPAASFSSSSGTLRSLKIRRNSVSFALSSAVLIAMSFAVSGEGVRDQFIDFVLVVVC